LVASNQRAWQVMGKTATGKTARGHKVHTAVAREGKTKKSAKISRENEI